MSSNPFLSKEVKLRRVLKGLGVALVCLITIPTIFYFVFKSEPIEEVEEDKVLGEETVTPYDWTQLAELVPEKYEVTRSYPEGPSEEEDGCIPIYYIYPNEYSEIEREYLTTASIAYCEDINRASIKSQIGEFRFNPEVNRWFYVDGETREIQEERVFGKNTVTFVEPWGSHYSWAAYIVRIEDSSEVIILLIPESNRIRCETYDEDGVESMDEECVSFRDSLPPVYADWVPEEVYEEDYTDLLEILAQINSVNLSDTNDFQTDYTKWLYNEADRIVNTYDFSSKEIKPLIQIPKYEFPEDKDVYEKSYELSSEDTVTVSCEKLKSEFTPVFDIHGCDVLLNSEEVLYAWSWTDNKEINPHITIFDDENLEYPVIAVGEQFGPASRDNLSVYEIIDGELIQLLFNSSEETWFVDPYAKMYKENSKEFFVTYFHDPAMIEKSLTRVWEVNNMSLSLIETILERGF
jgi:hypothetical protein